MDDSKILNDRLDNVVEKTLELEELHFDGAYGSQENDEKFAQHDITPVQTAIRGKSGGVEMEIQHHSETEYGVACPNQEVQSAPT